MSEVLNVSVAWRSITTTELDPQRLDGSVWAICVDERPTRRCAYISNGGSMLMTRAEWESLKDLVSRFYDITSDTEIELENLKTEQGHRRKEMELESRPVHSRPIEPGFVYVFGCDEGYYKIGKAQRVPDRLRQLGAKIPFKVYYIHSFRASNPHKAELSLHKKYAEKRADGEWFRLNESDVQEIKAIREM